MADDIYRRVAVRMWGDEKFRTLSPLLPSGQALWLVLLTGEQTGIIPGIFRIGEAAFAEQLRWPLKAFREAFAEAFGKGMVKADWEARLVWVPNAIRHNRPSSPNVIRHWETTWKLLPSCDLKTEAWQALKAFTEGLGEGWSKAFREACRDPLANQEAVSSDQEAVNKEEAKPPFPLRLEPNEDHQIALKVPSDADRVFAHWMQARKKRADTKFSTERQSKIKARLKEGFTVQQLCRAIDGVAKDPWPERGKSGNDDLTIILREATQVEKFLELADGETSDGPRYPSPEETTALIAKMRGLTQ